MNRTKSTDLYPLKFGTIFKSKIWGGEKIAPFKGVETAQKEIGESWEISPMEGDVSVVANGAFAGKTLNELVDGYGAEFLGEHVHRSTGGKFPLLVKIIDANDDLSVQVHPNDEYGLKHHNSLGKTEMWYLIDADPEAGIYAGWKKQTNSTEVKDLVKSVAILDYLELHKAKAEDVFFLPAGKVHTIGKGCLILEIQEASDITYRMYDFDRKDSEGNMRELHIDRAAEVLNYEVNTHSTEKYDHNAVDRLETLVKCNYFHTSLLHLTKPFSLPIGGRDSFTVLFVVEGEVKVTCDRGDELHLKKGETILIPASLKACSIEPLSPEARLVDSYVPKA